MLEIIIDEEFKGLLPALDAETFMLLEENIIQNGCRDSLILWGDILIDGHNRYSICMKHGIPFNTISKDFDSREDALIWIISNQVARRNLTPVQLSHYRGLHYKADKKKIGGYDRATMNEQMYQNDTNAPHADLSTAGRLAKQYKVSRPTINRDARIAEAIEAIGVISPEAKQKILTGEVKIDKKELEKLASVPVEKVAELVASIEDGAYGKRKPESPATPRSGSFDDGISAGEQPLEMVISRIKRDILYYSGLRNRVGGVGTSELKSALRSYIDILEDLYAQM